MADLKPARIKFYVDADVLGIAKVLMLTRVDVTYPGDPGGPQRDKRFRLPCPVPTPDIDDDEWLPIVAEQGWVVITKDSAIGRTRSLRDLALLHGNRIVAVGSKMKAMRTWDHLVVLLSVWDRIEKLADLPGPWMYRATKNHLSAFDGFPTHRPSKRD